MVHYLRNASTTVTVDNKGFLWILFRNRQLHDLSLLPIKKESTIHSHTKITWVNSKIGPLVDKLWVCCSFKSCQWICRSSYGSPNGLASCQTLYWTSLSLIVFCFTTRKNADMGLYPKSEICLHSPLLFDLR